MSGYNTVRVTLTLREPPASHFCSVTRRPALQGSLQLRQLLMTGVSTAYQWDEALSSAVCMLLKTISSSHEKCITCYQAGSNSSLRTYTRAWKTVMLSFPWDSATLEVTSVQ